MLKTDAEKMDFLLQHPNDLKGHISVRPINCLIGEGCQTLFSALARPYTELLRGPNMGRKSADEFATFVRANGFEPGDTQAVYELYAPFFTYINPDKDYPRMIDKKLSAVQTIDRGSVFIEDYKAKITEFLNPTFVQRRVQAATKREHRDIDWIISLLPQDLQRIDGHFNHMALADPEFQKQFGPLREQVRDIAVRAIRLALTKG